MPEDDDDLVDKEAWVTGWGRLYEGKKKVEIRNVIVIVIVMMI